MASFRNLLGLPVKDWDNRASGQVLQLSSDKEHWEFGAGGGGGTASPLTTKGDLYGYDTDNARVPVGTDGQVLVADSSKALGVKWAEGNGIHIDDRVSTYANLPSPPTEGTGATYLVKDGGSYPDNLLYVWNGTSWDAEGEGMAIGGRESADKYWPLVGGLLHFDGDSGSQLYIDETGGSWDQHGTVALDTSIKKFGSASLKGTNDNGYITSDNSRLALDATKDFTLEAWVRIGAAGDSVWLLDQRSDIGGLFFGVNVTAGRILQARDDNVDVIDASAASFPLNQFNHVALAKSGTSWYAFINGMQVGSTNTHTATDGGTTTYIGASYSSGSHFNGYIDEWRLTIGVARYTSNFTPPSRAF